MKIAIRHQCPDFGTYRAARVKSLFNVETGDRFELDAELPIEDQPWSIGVVVGPSGSGKSSIGKAMFGEAALWQPKDWPADAPLIEAIAQEASFDAVTGALAAVGLGSVPAWLRPWPVLSTGEKFRADLARLILEAPAHVVVDEFTSVIDRQIARIGAHAFSRAWRRTGGQAVLLSCHRDVLDWLEPDWVFDTGAGTFSARWLCRPGEAWFKRPSITLEIEACGWEHWPVFEAHHYLKLPRMIAATNYIGRVDGQPVAHLAVSTRQGHIEARACRLVVMPEWQGAGVGLRFLNAICAAWRRGENRYAKPMLTLFHTSHPGLAAALRRDRNWCQVSAHLFGEQRARCRASLEAAAARKGKEAGGTGAFGGHFRAVQGFRYVEGWP